jgi:hypothetical protein
MERFRQIILPLDEIKRMYGGIIGYKEKHSAIKVLNVLIMLDIPPNSAMHQ